MQAFTLKRHLTALFVVTLLASTVGHAQVGPGPGGSFVIPAGQTLVNAINITSAPYNVSTSSADNATGLQSAINAAIAANIPLYVPAPVSGCYKYTAPLTAGGNLSIVGDWVAGNWNGGENVPLGTPPLVGSVLCPTSNGSDAIDVTTQTLTVNLTNIGFQFQTPFTGTGDGFHYIPAGTQQGLTNFRWQNVIVYGTDGNHYAVNLQNALYGQADNVSAFGGGVLQMYGNAVNFGNIVFNQLYGQVFAFGTADGVYLHANAAGETALLQFNRPQILFNNYSSLWATPPTGSQYIWHEDANVKFIGKKCPDWEQYGSTNAPVLLGAGAFQNDIDSGCMESTAYPSGTLNAPSWTTKGLMYGPVTRILNDTTSTGTVALESQSAFPAWTLTASGTTTFTEASTLYLGAPAASTNVTIGTPDSLYAASNIHTTGSIRADSGVSQIAGTVDVNQNASTGTTNIGNGSTSGTVTIGGPQNITALGGTVVATGSAAGATGSCAITTRLGGNAAGSFVANGACVSGTVILTFSKAATNGFVCDIHDLTTLTDAMNESAYSTTTVTFTGSMAASDLVAFKCEGF